MDRPGKLRHRPMVIDAGAGWCRSAGFEGWMGAPTIAFRGDGPEDDARASLDAGFTEHL